MVPKPTKKVIYHRGTKVTKKAILAREVRNKVAFVSSCLCGSLRVSSFQIGDLKRSVAAMSARRMPGSMAE